MSISPFSARPTPSDGESRRARLVVAIAVVGIAATLLAYAISPGVRHAVSQSTHSVKHAVGNVLDHDASKRVPKAPVKPAPARAKSTTSTAP
jgi:type II secretory pathway pseudopilin PulG